RHIENVIAISDLEAAEALTRGIAGLAGYERVVVCVVEPSAAVVAGFTPDGVTVDRVDAAALDDVDDASPDAVFVVGSGDLDVVVAALERNDGAPVISADEADLALARGSALASAAAVSLLDAPTPPVEPDAPRTAKLASLLAAAVVTFVASLSAALGMTLVSDDSPPQVAGSEAAVPEATPAPPNRGAPRTPKSAAPRTSEVPATAEPVAVAVPVPDAALIVEQPVGELPALREPIAPPPGLLAPAPPYIPPAPAYVPPAPPPNYLPPAPVPASMDVLPVQPQAAQVPTGVVQQQQPRLRDRIIERIPIINRFHEPDPYGQ
ncbi:MAG: hypothetical protein K0U76_17395, partial [Actinomycetia bacterium]|nr:hypothetical protein [Actinomycetes bacterium]